MSTNHPSEIQLALYSGEDLGRFERWRVRRHVSTCSQCRQEVQAFRQSVDSVRELADSMPGQVTWPRLAPEMTGNIRVGLAAGECIAGFEKIVRPVRPRLIWHSALVLASVSVVALCSLWFNLPKAEMQHLASALQQVRWERLGTTFRTPTLAEGTVILEASPSQIEVKANGSALSMLHPRSEGATVSVNMQDSAGLRYIDADTGQVTTNKVYYAQ